MDRMKAMMMKIGPDEAKFIPKEFIRSKSDQRDTEEMSRDPFYPT